MSWRKSWLLLVVAIVALGWVAPQLQAAPVAKRVEVTYPLKFDVSPPLRDMVPQASKTRTPFEVPNRPDVRPGRAGQGDISAVLQTAFGAPNTPDPIVGWAGLDVFDDAPILGYYLMPPDTQGDIGKDHYIQWINSIFAIWDKTGTKVFPTTDVAVPGNILWTGFGGDCENTNDGDPITLWDPLAERWVMSQFTAIEGTSQNQCVAISATSDPLGTWYRYVFPWPNGYLNDYPKLGVWSDAYYITSNNFTSSFVGVTAGAFDRAAMLAGSPTAGFVHFELSTDHYSMLPADLDGLNAPPAGAPGLFAEMQFASDWSPPLASNQIWVFELHVDWANPTASTFGVGAAHDPNYVVAIAPVGYNCSGRDCIPQPGSSQKLDDIDGRLMHRLAYRNFGTHQSMVGSMTVDGTAGNAGLWWGELQDTGSGWGLYQEGVYSPADALHRFMPSIAQDTNGNIMMVYTASASTITYPSVNYVGRLAGDPLGVMGDEKVLAAGAQSQVGGNRWGDYSMISVDPVDDCTFWMTGEYVLEPPNGSVAWNWNTFIGSAKFPTCSTGPAGIVEGYVKSAADSSPIQGAQVHVGTYSTSTNAAGFFQITVPVGTYDVTAAKFGYGPNGVTGVEVTDGNTTNVGDILLAPVGTYFVDGFVTAADHNWPLWAKLEIKQGTTLINTIYTSPWNGYYEVELANGYTYDFNVTSMYVGYVGETRPVAVAAGDQTQNFALPGASGNPAYTCFLEGGINESFDGDFPPQGWTVRTLAGPNNIWKRNDEWGRANETGGTGFAAAADSDKAGSGSGAFNTELWSPPIKMPAAARNLKFKSSFKRLTTDTGTLDVSTNGGATWTNLLTLTATGISEPAVDMTAYAGQTIILRFKFTCGSWEYYWQVDDVRTETIPAMPPPAMAEAFEAGVPPAGWSQVDAAGSGVIWKTNVDWGRTPNPVSGGTGMAAGCDSDKAGSGKTYDCALLTAAFSVDGLVTPTLSVKMYYNDISTLATRDFFDIDISTDGGTSWASLAHYDADQAGTRTFDLTGVATGTNNVLRFRYYTVDLVAHWDWYAYIDDVTISSAPPPVVVDTPTLVCESVAGSLVAGFVTDANTAAGIEGATVVRDLGGMAETMEETGGQPDGFYYMFSALPTTNGPSTRTFTASKDGYGPVTKQVILVPDTINRIDFALPAASLSLPNWPFVIDGRLTPDGEPAWDKTDDFAILNNGGLPANVKVMASKLGTGYVPPMPKQPRGPLTMAPEVIAKSPFNLKGVPRLITPNLPELPNLAAGDVLASWPTGLALAWGCGVTGDTVWASNPSAGGGDDYDYEFTAAGALTGRKVQAVFGGSWAADMSRADNAGMLWQVNVGGDNCIYEVDPNAGATGNKICPAFGTSERGLAYDPDSDTFFAGGWNDLTIFRFDRTGAILQQVNTGLSIAGLAYNPATQHLFVMVNDAPNQVVVLDVANGYTPIGSFSVAGFDDYSGSGIEFGCDGLWAMNQNDGKAYLIDAGEMYPCNPNLPWFVMTPTEGTVPASGQFDVHAEFFPDGVDAAHYGLFRAVVNSTNDTPDALPGIPVYFTKAFWDIPRGFWADAFVHALAGARITKGCGGGNFCPDTNITRSNMAIQMVRALHGPDFVPPPAIGVFADVVISDTDTTADYIEQLYNDGIVSGCDIRGGVRYYCPNDLVNRAQMAIFVGKGLGLTPVDPPTGYFTDVHGTGYAYAEAWIEAIFNAGITAGCGDHIFCPGDDITRAQLAVWLVKGLNIPVYLHPMP